MSNTDSPHKKHTRGLGFDVPYNNAAQPFIYEGHFTFTWNCLAVLYFFLVILFVNYEFLHIRWIKCNFLFLFTNLYCTKKLERYCAF